ncbi:conserved hypothetical protein [Neospora caninum Liverpool]|uniref:Uncharacterized protein n=1 Tax=Neospora caninum (strain Liverpool) TaxID=572307 RepID=F0VJL8_NEOCL|nr:conserved hypothetical protein [Neospora caninum Liverpool]CBZ53929.1 conserved hypothetical protein [Neospora caninum Liverpool]CEL67927.1 TPA: hypothetical protein BN1204_037110 [Neospora caninum Liverpool]|eukprot:XP_003883961.1 conserved hypothetical protein [Neospora caninum Liverpool]
MASSGGGLFGSSRQPASSTLFGGGSATTGSAPSHLPAANAQAAPGSSLFTTATPAASGNPTSNTTQTIPGQQGISLSPSYASPSSGGVSGFSPPKSAWGGRQFECLYTEVICPAVQKGATWPSASQLRERLAELQNAALAAASSDAPTNGVEVCAPPHAPTRTSPPPRGSGQKSSPGTSRRDVTSSPRDEEDYMASLEEEQATVRAQLDALLAFQRSALQRILLFQDAFVNVLAVPERQVSVSSAQLEQFARENYPGWERLCKDIDQLSQLHNLDQFMCFSLAFDAVQILQETTPSSDASSLSSLGSVQSCDGKEKSGNGDVMWDPQLILAALHREQHFQLLCLFHLAVALYAEDSLGVYGDVENACNPVSVSVFSRLARRGFVENLLDRIGSLASTLVCPPLLPSAPVASVSSPSSQLPSPKENVLFGGASPYYATLLSPFPSVLSLALAAGREALASTSSSQPLSESVTASSPISALAAVSEVHDSAMLDLCLKILHFFFARFQPSMQDVQDLLLLIPHVLSPHANVERIRTEGRLEKSSSMGAYELDAKFQAALRALGERESESLVGGGRADGPQGVQAAQEERERRTRLLYGEDALRRIKGGGAAFFASLQLLSRPLSFRLAEILLVALHPKLLRWFVRRGPETDEAEKGADKDTAMRHLELPPLTELNPMSSPQDIQECRGDVLHQEEDRPGSTTLVPPFSLSAEGAGEDRPGGEGARSASLARLLIPPDAGLFYDKLAKLRHAGQDFWRDDAGLECLLRFIVCGIYMSDARDAWDALVSSPGNLFVLLGEVFLRGRSPLDAIDLLSFQLVHEFLWLGFVASSLPSMSSPLFTEEGRTSLLTHLVEVEVHRARTRSFSWMIEDFRKEEEETPFSFSSPVSPYSCFFSEHSFLGAPLLQTEMASCFYQSSEDGPAPEEDEDGEACGSRWRRPAGWSPALFSPMFVDRKGKAERRRREKTSRFPFSHTHIERESDECSGHLLALLKLIAVVCRAYPAACTHYTDLLSYCIEQFSFLFDTSLYGEDGIDAGSLNRPGAPASSLTSFLPRDKALASYSFFPLANDADDAIPPASAFPLASPYRGASERYPFSPLSFRPPLVPRPLSSSSLFPDAGSSTDALLGPERRAALPASSELRVVSAAARELGVSLVLHPPLLVALLNLSSVLASRGGPLVAQRVAANFGTPLLPSLRFSRLFLTLFQQLEASLRGQYAALPQYFFLGRHTAFPASSLVSALDVTPPALASRACPSPSFLGSSTLGRSRAEDPREYPNLFSFSGPDRGRALGARHGDAEGRNEFLGGMLREDKHFHLLDRSKSFPRGLLACLETCLRLAGSLSNSFLLYLLPLPFPTLPERLCPLLPASPLYGSRGKREGLRGPFASAGSASPLAQPGLDSEYGSSSSSFADEGARGEGWHMLDFIYEILHMNSNNKNISLLGIKAACLEALTGNLVRNPSTSLAVLLQLSSMIDSLRRDLNLPAEKPGASRDTADKRESAFLSPSSPVAEDEGRLLLAFTTCVAYHLQLVGLRRRFDATLAAFWARVADSGTGDCSGQGDGRGATSCAPAGPSREARERKVEFAGLEAPREACDASGGTGGAGDADGYLAAGWRGQLEPYGAPATSGEADRGSALSCSAVAANGDAFFASPQERAAAVSPSGGLPLETDSDLGDLARLHSVVGSHLTRLTAFLLEIFVTVFREPFQRAWQSLPQARYWRLAVVLLRSFRLVLRGPLPRIGAHRVDAAAREPFGSCQRATAEATTYLFRAFLCLESEAFDALMKVACFHNATSRLSLSLSHFLLSQQKRQARSPATPRNPFAACFAASPFASWGVGACSSFALRNGMRLGPGGAWERGAGRFGTYEDGVSSFSWERQRREAEQRVGPFSSSAPRRASESSPPLAASSWAARNVMAEEVAVVGLDVLRLLFQRDVLFLQFYRRQATLQLQSAWEKRSTEGRSWHGAETGDAREVAERERAEERGEPLTGGPSYCTREGRLTSSSPGLELQSWEGSRPLWPSGQPGEFGVSPSPGALPEQLSGAAANRPGGSGWALRTAETAAADCLCLRFTHEQLARSASSLVQELLWATAGALGLEPSPLRFRQAKGQGAPSSLAVTSFLASLSSSLSIPPFSWFVLVHLGGAGLRGTGTGSRPAALSASLSPSSYPPSLLRVWKLSLFTLHQLSVRDQGRLSSLFAAYPGILDAARETVTIALLMTPSRFLTLGDCEQDQVVFGTVPGGDREDEGAGDREEGWEAQEASERKGSVAASRGKGAGYFLSQRGDGDATALTRFVTEADRVSEEEDNYPALVLPSCEDLADPLYATTSLSSFFLEVPSTWQKKTLRQALLSQCVADERERDRESVLLAALRRSSFLQRSRDVPAASGDGQREGSESDSLYADRLQASSAGDPIFSFPLLRSRLSDFPSLTEARLERRLNLSASSAAEKLLLSGGEEAGEEAGLVLERKDEGLAQARWMFRSWLRCAFYAEVREVDEFARLQNALPASSGSTALPIRKDLDRKWQRVEDAIVEGTDLASWQALRLQETRQARLVPGRRARRGLTSHATGGAAGRGDLGGRDDWRLPLGGYATGLGEAGSETQGDGTFDDEDFLSLFPSFSHFYAASRPMVHSNRWVDAAYLREEGEAPPSKWILPPFLPPGCPAFAYTYVPANYQSAAFHATSFRRLALLLLHAGVQRACLASLASSPAAGSRRLFGPRGREGGWERECDSAFSPDMSSKGVEAERGDTQPPAPPTCLPLSLALLGLAPVTDAVAECAPSGAKSRLLESVARTSPASLATLAGAFSPASRSAQDLRSRAVRNLGVLIGDEGGYGGKGGRGGRFPPLRSSAVVLPVLWWRGQDACLSSGSSPGTTRGGVRPGQVAEALVALLRERPHFEVFDDAVGDLSPQTLDPATGVLVRESERQAAIVANYSQHWEFLKALQILHLLAVTEATRAAALQLLACQWPERYQHFDALASCIRNVPRFPLLLRPLFLLQLSSTAEICAVEIRETLCSVGSARRFVKGHLAHTERRQAGLPSGAATGGCGRDRTAGLAGQLEGRREGGQGGEKNGAQAAGGTGSDRAARQIGSASDGERVRPVSASPQDVIDDLVLVAHRLLNPAPNLGEERDLLFSFSRLLFAFEKSIQAPSLLNSLGDTLHSVATASASRREEGEPHARRHSIARAASPKPGRLFDRFLAFERVTRARRGDEARRGREAEERCLWMKATGVTRAVALCLQLCERDLTVLSPSCSSQPESASAPSASLSASLIDPLLFLKLRDTILSPLASHTPLRRAAQDARALPASVERLLALSNPQASPSCFSSLHAHLDDAASSRSLFELAGSGETRAMWNRHPDLIAAFLTSLWIDAFHANVAKFTALALQTALAALPCLARACYTLLSPCFLQLASSLPRFSLSPSPWTERPLAAASPHARLHIAQRSLETLEGLLAPQLVRGYSISQIYGLTRFLHLSLSIWCTETLLMSDEICVATASASPFSLRAREEQRAAGASSVTLASLFSPSFPTQLARLLVRLLLSLSGAGDASSEDGDAAAGQNSRSALGASAALSTTWTVRALLYDGLVLLFRLPIFGSSSATSDCQAGGAAFGFSGQDGEPLEQTIRRARDDDLATDRASISRVAISLLTSLAREPDARSKLFRRLLHDAILDLRGGVSVVSSPASVEGAALCLPGNSESLFWLLAALAPSQGTRALPCGLPLPYGAAAGLAASPTGLEPRRVSSIVAETATQAAFKQLFPSVPQSLALGALRVLTAVVQASLPAQLEYEGAASFATWVRLFTGEEARAVATDAQEEEESEAPAVWSRKDRPPAAPGCRGERGRKAARETRQTRRGEDRVGLERTSLKPATERRLGDGLEGSHATGDSGYGGEGEGRREVEEEATGFAEENYARDDQRNSSEADLFEMCLAAVLLAHLHFDEAPGVRNGHRDSQQRGLRRDDGGKHSSAVPGLSSLVSCETGGARRRRGDTREVLELALVTLRLFHTACQHPSFARDCVSRPLPSQLLSALLSRGGSGRVLGSDVCAAPAASSFRLLDLFLSSPLLRASMQTMNLRVFLSSAVAPSLRENRKTEEASRSLVAGLSNALVTVVPVDLYLSFLSVLQTLLGLDPLPGRLVDRAIEWVNREACVFLFPLRFLARLATAWTETRRSNASPLSRFPAALRGVLPALPGRKRRSLSSFEGSFQVESLGGRQSEVEALCAALDRYCATSLSFAAETSRAESSEEFGEARTAAGRPEETVGRVYLAACASLRVYLQLLKAERNRRNSENKIALTHQLIRADFGFAAEVESLIDTLLAFLLIDPASFEEREEDDSDEDCARRRRRKEDVPAPGLELASTLREIPESDDDETSDEDISCFSRSAGRIGTARRAGLQREDDDLHDESERREPGSAVAGRQPADAVGFWSSHRRRKTNPTLRLLLVLQPENDAVKWDTVLLMLQVVGFSLGCYNRRFATFTLGASVDEEARSAASKHVDSVCEATVALSVLAVKTLLDDRETRPPHFASAQAFALFLSSLEAALHLLHGLLLLCLRVSPAAQEPSPLDFAPLQEREPSRLFTPAGAAWPSRGPFHPTRTQELLALHPQFLDFLPLLDQLSFACAAGSPPVAFAGASSRRRGHERRQQRDEKGDEGLSSARLDEDGRSALGAVAFFADRLKTLIYLYLRT